ncbi:DUF6078 family protein [Parabacteroides timonensis]|uniref:DUF6078 family protein n=1 Tax=Parabacteroides timonensis TaxID=1871013 RepID=UPI00094E8113|nr:DUF6078 family protein [Parabacteroides timonensis]
MKESFDYSKVPYDFGLCAAENCPKATTCLRQIALKHAPENITFLRIMNPNTLKKMKGTCKFYRPNTKIQNAIGFMRTVNALTLRVADTFRLRMISYLGRKNYYLKRRGGSPLSPAEQQHIVILAKELGVILDEYFDGYVESYDWG